MPRLKSALNKNHLETKILEVSNTDTVGFVTIFPALALLPWVEGRVHSNLLFLSHRERAVRQLTDRVSARQWQNEEGSKRDAV